MKNTLILLLGIFVGSLNLIFNFKPTSIEGQKEEKLVATAKVPLVMDTSPNDAKEMISNLYAFMKKNPEKTPALFNRSYALDFRYFNQIIEKHDLINFVNDPANKSEALKIRIYPALRKQGGNDILTFVMMIEKNGTMLWDSNNPNSPQLEIQDQMGLCPDVCPLENDLFTESEWKKKTSLYN